MKRLALLLLVGVTLAACSEPAASPQTGPSVPRFASCDDGLQPIREYMAEHDEPLTTEAKAVLRQMVVNTYSACSPTQFRAFAEKELKPWSERVGEAPAG